jgi:carboxymethylenebutenolidase
MSTKIEHFVSGGKPIAAEVFRPATPGRHPAVLILHGSFGLLPQYRADIVSFAEALEAKGTVAVLPHYFERTGTIPGIDATTAIPKHLHDWQATVADALAFTRAHPAVNAGRLGVIGFSLGGHLALHLAMTPVSGTGLKCVVDFFGPTRAPRLHGNRSTLPPVLIHHGMDDLLVDIEDSVDLVSELRAAGKVEGVGYRFSKYPGQGHGFTGPDLKRSRSTTVDFIGAIV